MDTVDRYIDIVYNDKPFTADEFDNINSFSCISIFLGLIKQDKYDKAEIIMRKAISYMEMYPIKVCKHIWHDKSVLNILLNKLYMNEKNLISEISEYPCYCVLYTHMFFDHSIEHIIRYIRYRLYIANDKILKIYMIIATDKYHHAHIHCANEKLTHIFYTKIFNYKLPTGYIFKYIYEIQIACELDMDMNDICTSQMYITIYAIMNNLSYKPYNWYIEISRFIFE